MTISYQPIWDSQQYYITKNLELYIDGLAQDEELLREKAHAALPNEWQQENNDRLFDFTCHPSQINVPLRTIIVTICTSLRDLWRQEHDKNPASDIANITIKLKKMLPAIMETMRGDIEQAWHKPNNINGVNFISSLNSAAHINLKYIEHHINDLDDIAYIAHNIIHDQRLDNTDLLDEVAEVTSAARNWLLNGNAVYLAWLDYDGAKRPAGLGYSIFASLLISDMRRIYKKGNFPQHVQDLRDETRKIDLAIHGLSLIMAKEQDDIMFTKQHLLMRYIKTLRFSKLQQLVRLRNEASILLKKDQGKREVSLSRRIRFGVRLDSKTADTAILKSVNDPSINKEDKELLESICQQIKELNELSSDDYLPDGHSLHRIYQPICAQVMIANAGVDPNSLSPNDITDAAYKTVERVKAIRAELTALETYRQIMSNSRINTTKYTLIVPLFESADTITPEFITAYLDALWNKLERDPCLSSEQDELERRKSFNNRYSELFFAGSDSSRVIGHYAARVNVAKTIQAAHIWAKEHEVTINVKFGTGESAFRQAGYIDIMGGRPLYDAAIHNNTQQCANWAKIFGDNWHDIAKPYMGFSFTLRHIKGINSFTAQARSNEVITSLLTPAQIRDTIANLYAMRDVSLHDIYNPMDYICNNAAQHGRTSYIDVMGDEHTPKPYGLVSYPALLEYFIASGFFPKLRPRGLSRQTLMNDADKCAYIATHGGINSRAIAATHASMIIFPLSLIDKGDILDNLEHDGQRRRAFMMIEMESLLRETMLFTRIAHDFFHLFEGYESWLPAISDLKRRWDAWLKHHNLMRDIYMGQLLSEAHYAAFTQASHVERQAIIASLNPDIRVLLRDDMPNPNADLYQQGWQYVKPYIVLIIAYLHYYTMENTEQTHHIKNQMDSYKKNNTIEINMALGYMASALGYIG